MQQQQQQQSRQLPQQQAQAQAQQANRQQSQVPSQQQQSQLSPIQPSVKLNPSSQIPNPAYSLTGLTQMLQRVSPDLTGYHQNAHAAGMGMGGTKSNLASSSASDATADSWVSFALIVIQSFVLALCFL
jgi:hypothetical protein